MELKSITFPGLAGEYQIPDPSQFAPSGYGLGNEKVKELTSSDDINNIRENGWYAWTNSVPQNAPINYSIMRVWGGVWSGTGNYYCVQELYTGNQNYANVIMRRTGGTNWCEWEYENPPMLLGVEYRTTERHDGKAVYTRLGSYTFTQGFGDTSTVSNIAISFGNISATKILSAEMVLIAESTDREYPVPITAGSGGLLSVNAVLHNGAAVLISNKYAVSAGGIMYCTLRYTKD